jgi:hypothetical protein
MNRSHSAHRLSQYLMPFWMVSTTN